MFGIRNPEQDDSRKDAKDAKFGEDWDNFSLPAWRLGAKIFAKVFILETLAVTIKSLWPNATRA